MYGTLNKGSFRHIAGSVGYIDNRKYRKKKKEY
jgi:hypothetical protein